MFASSASGGGQRGLSDSFAELDGDGTLLAQQMPKNGDLARVIQGQSLKWPSATRRWAECQPPLLHRSATAGLMLESQKTPVSLAA